MRQARRSYRHLPVELHEQGFDQAGLALRTGAPPAMDRRVLYAELARHLDEELRRIHVGWCLNQTRLTTEAPPSDTAPGTQQPVAAFIEDGLGGLERAVLQLELGAGRDTSTVRAALRLGPGQYARHRELGLGKLRGVIAGTIRGRVCDQHLDSVTLAATGDRGAAERLSSGPERCRACAREAAGLSRVLQQRLALAPWPLAIKPAGILATKLGALGAMIGGKSAGGFAGAGFTGTASGAKVVAGVVAAAAVASGGIAAVESDPAKHPAAPAVSAVVAAPAATSSARSTGATAATKRRDATTRRPQAADRSATAKRGRASEKADKAAVAAAAQPPAAQPSEAGTQTANRPAKPTDTVRKTVDTVKKTVDDVTGKLPVAVPKVDDVAPGLDKTVDDAVGAVDGLLTP